MQELLTPEVTKLLLSLTSVLITGLVGWGAKTINERTGYDIDARAQATLHSALNTGALMAWSRVNDGVVAPNREDLIEIVLEHVLGEGAGGAVSKLGVSDYSVRNLAEAKLMDISLRMQDETARFPTAKSLMNAEGY